MLVAISYATAVNTATNAERKESPLYGVRTKRAIGEKIGNILENLKTKFLGNRMFFLPSNWLRNLGEKQTWTEYQIACPTQKLVC